MIIGQVINNSQRKGNVEKPQKIYKIEIKQT